MYSNDDKLSTWFDLVYFFSKMETRSKDLLCTIGSIEFFKSESMNLSVLKQLPTYRYLYERYFTMQKSFPQNMKGRSSFIVADLSKEFTYIWTHMNIPFMDMFFFGWQDFWGPKWQKIGKMTIVSRKIMNITWYLTQSIVLGYYVIQYIWKVKFVSTYWENIPFVFLNIVVDRINLDGCTIAYVLLQSM